MGRFRSLLKKFLCKLWPGRGLLTQLEATPFLGPRLQPVFSPAAGEGKTGAAEVGAGVW